MITFFIRFKTNALGATNNSSLSVDDLEYTEKTIIKMTQRKTFAAEFRSLERNEQVLKTGKLASLFPYIDNNDILRVGGRLARVDIPKKYKHPLVLSTWRHLTILIIKKWMSDYTTVVRRIYCTRWDQDIGHWVADERSKKLREVASSVFEIGKNSRNHYGSFAKWACTRSLKGRF